MAFTILNNQCIRLSTFTYCSFFIFFLLFNRVVFIYIIKLILESGSGTFSPVVINYELKLWIRLFFSFLSNLLCILIIFKVRIHFHVNLPQYRYYQLSETEISPLNQPQWILTQIMTNFTDFGKLNGESA